MGPRLCQPLPTPPWRPAGSAGPARSCGASEAGPATSRRTLVAGAKLSRGLVAVDHLHKKEGTARRADLSPGGGALCRGGAPRTLCAAAPLLAPGAAGGPSPCSPQRSPCPSTTGARMHALHAWRPSAPHLCGQHAPGHHRLSGRADGGSALQGRLGGAVPACRGHDGPRACMHALQAFRCRQARRRRRGQATARPPLSGHPPQCAPSCRCCQFFTAFTASSKTFLPSPIWGTGTQGGGRGAVGAWLSAPCTVVVWLPGAVRRVGPAVARHAAAAGGCCASACSARAHAHTQKERVFVWVWRSVRAAQHTPSCGWLSP